MADLTVFNREQKIYLALWRKAIRDRVKENLPPVSLILSSKSTALAVRVNMYRTIRPFREEKLFDTELKAAADIFALTLTPEEGDKWKVTIAEKRTLSEMEAQLADLGIFETDLMTPEERDALDKLKDFITPEPGASTEFYKR